MECVLEFGMSFRVYKIVIILGKYSVYRQQWQLGNRYFVSSTIKRKRKGGNE